MRIENPDAPDAGARGRCRYEHAGPVLPRHRRRACRTSCRAWRGAAVLRRPLRARSRRTSLDYTGSGHVIPVYDLASALAAINQIEEQGEGVDAEGGVGRRSRHVPSGRGRGRALLPVSGGAAGPVLSARRYAGDRTDRARRSTIDWDAVYPMRDNPRTPRTIPPARPVREKMDAFNRLLLATCCAACTARSTASRAHMFVADDRHDDAEGAGAGTDADAERRRPDDGRTVVRLRAAAGRRDRLSAGPGWGETPGARRAIINDGSL